jgi:hypothetical protein
MTWTAPLMTECVKGHHGDKGGKYGLHKPRRSIRPFNVAMEEAYSFGVTPTAFKGAGKAANSL